MTGRAGVADADRPVLLGTEVLVRVEAMGVNPVKPGLAAWQSLVDTARLVAGQRVLIHGAGDGVGHLAVQIAWF